MQNKPFLELFGIVSNCFKSHRERHPCIAGKPPMTRICWNWMHVFLESLLSCAPPPIVWSVSYSEVRILSNMCKEIATNYFHWRFASNKGSYVANPTLWNGAKFWPKLSTQKFKRSKNSNKKSNASYYLWPEWKDGIQKDSKSTFTNICQTASLRFSVNRENFCKSRPDFHKTRPTSTRTSGKYTARSFN